MLALSSQINRNHVAVAALLAVILLGGMHVGDRLLGTYYDSWRSAHAEACFTAAQSLLQEKRSSLDGYSTLSLEGIYSPDTRCIAHVVFMEISYYRENDGPGFSYIEAITHDLDDVYSGRKLGSYFIQYRCRNGDTDCSVDRSSSSENNLLQSDPSIDRSMGRETTYELTLMQFLALKQSVTAERFTWVR